jgi:Subtilase family
MKRTSRHFALSLPVLVMGMWLHSAHAQVNLPQVRVPQLPVDLPLGVDRTLNTVTDRLDPQKLVDLRKLQITELVRKHRDVIERDPNGEAIVRSEVTAFSPSDDALARARAAGFTVIRERTLEGLDAKIIVLQSPPGLSTRRALQQLRKLDPAGTYDFNHVYSASGWVTGEIGGTQIRAHGPVAYAGSAESVAVNAGSANAESAVAASEFGKRIHGGRVERGEANTARSSAVAIRLVANDPPSTSPVNAAAGSGKVGLIDGGVDAGHAVFRGTTIHQHGCNGTVVPSAHGTAVASLLVGRSEKFHGALPGATLYAADVYCDQPTGGAVDAVADAFAWLARERVPTINVSLVGPSNATLQSVVRVVTSRGFIVVAAVGNDGPAAPPLYPANYPDVVGVTGVDARQRALFEAARGRQVDFAAPGADMAAADTAKPYATVRGTSFAAPIVSGLLAASMTQPDKAAADHAIAALIQQAVDLGSRGVDSTYGNGLVGNALRMEPALAKARAPQE